MELVLCRTADIAGGGGQCTPYLHLFSANKLCCCGTLGVWGKL